MTAPQFLELAVSLSLQAALVIVLTQALCRLSRHSVVVQCRLWTCCYVLLLLIVVAGLLLPHWRPVRPWSELSPAAIVGVASFETQVGRMAFLIWAAGAAVSAVSFCAGWIIEARVLRRCPPIPTDQLALDDQLPERDSEGRPIAYVAGPDGSGPCCWQFHRPYIVLPSAVLQRGRRERTFIVRHEIQHLRLRHPLQLFLQRVVGIAFWFHPMVWWASWQSGLVREFACDEAALETRADIVDYLRTLLTTVEQISAGESRTPGTLAFGIGPGVIARRARRLVSLAQSAGTASPDSAGWRSPACVAAVAAALIAATVWLPVNVLVSGRTGWSPWPRWTAGVLHDFGVVVRDFETYDERTQMHEVLEQATTTPGIPRSD